MAQTTDNRFRNGVFLVYPDSAPENWIDILRAQLVPFIVSPLHDKDKDLSELDGDLCLVSKKAHWHVAVTCDGNKPLSYFVDLAKSVNGSTAWKIQNLRSMLRYFCHLDNPEKFQYSTGDVRCYSGASYEQAFELQGVELLHEIKKIIRYSYQHQCDSFQDLVRHLMTDNEDDWLNIVARQCTMFFSSLLKDIHFINKEKKSNESNTNSDS